MMMYCIVLYCIVFYYYSFAKNDSVSTGTGVGNVLLRGSRLHADDIIMIIKRHGVLITTTIYDGALELLWQ